MRARTRRVLLGVAAALALGACAVDPRVAATAYYDRGVLAQRTHRDRPALAAEAFERATELDPTHVEAWVELGRVRRQLEQHDLALAALERALALAPQPASVHRLHALVHRDRRDWVRALESFDRAIALDPRHAPDWANRAQVRAALGEREAARADAERALALGRDASRLWVGFFHWYAALLIHDGEYGRGVSLLRDGARHGLDGGRLSLWLHAALVLAGDADAARRELRAHRALLAGSQEWPVALIDHGLGEVPADQALAGVPARLRCEALFHLAQLQRGAGQAGAAGTLRQVLSACAPETIEHDLALRLSRQAGD